MGLAVSGFRESNQGYNDQAPAKPSQKTYSGYKGNGKPDGTYWLSEIRKGIAFRKKCAFEAKWETWRKYYRGEFESGVLPVNIYFKMVRTLVPRVYFRNPSISISPAKPGDDHYALAQILERIDNRLLVQMKVKQAIKSMTQNAFMFGTGVGKLGYGAQYTPTPDFLEASAPTGGKLDFRVEYNDLVLPNMPWFLSTHPGQFILPAGSTTIHEARWNAHWIKRHIDDVRDDPRLSNTAGINISKAYWSDISREDRQREEGLVDLVEVRDKKTQEVFVMAPYHNSKILYHDHDEMQDTGATPFFPLIFNEDDMFFWGVPDAQILDPQQRELNEIRTLMMKHRRVSLIKMIAKREAFTPDEISKLTDESVVPVVMIEENASVNDVRVLESANIPQGLVTMDALVERDVQEILGLGANQFGEYAPGSADRSATEAQIVNMATQIRMDERRDTVADLLTDLIHQVHNIIFNRWTGEQVIDLVGPGGVPIWVKFRPEELRQTGYNVLINPDSTLPETKQVREQKAIQVYTMLQQNPLIDKHKLTAYLLRELHGAEYDDMMITPEQAQAMQQQQQLQQQQALSLQQYQKMVPALRAIAGKGGMPQAGPAARAA